MQNARSSLCKKQWTIFMRKQWTVLVNAENRFYEKTVNNLCSEQFMQWIENNLCRKENEQFFK